LVFLEVRPSIFVWIFQGVLAGANAVVPEPTVRENWSGNYAGSVFEEKPFEEQLTSPESSVLDLYFVIQHHVVELTDDLVYVGEVGHTAESGLEVDKKLVVWENFDLSV